MVSDFLLKDLPKLLEKCHGVETVVLIDEYDLAEACASSLETYKSISDSLNHFMDCLLKGNGSVQMGLLMSVMPVTFESMFPGFNNASYENVTSNFFGEQFGFTCNEVIRVLNELEHSEKYKEVKEWYGGYRFKEEEMINPRSFMKYISNNFTPDVYWTSPARDDIIRSSMKANEYAYMKLKTVLYDTLVTKINTHASYRELKLYFYPSLMSSLFMSGYLTGVWTTREYNEYLVWVPNI